MYTPQDFINDYNGKWVDFDGVYGAQCVDAFKQSCATMGVPVKPCPDGWAQSYWTHRDQLGFSQYFYYITDKSQVQKGDWCIWLKRSSNVYSHIAMYVRDAGNNRGYYFGENQGGSNGSFNIAVCYNDWAGALRFKEWAKDANKPAPESNPVDQILTYGSKVQFYETVIDNVNPDHTKNLIHSSFYGGWFSGYIFDETTADDGALDQWVHIGSKGKISGTFTVGDIDIPNQMVKLNELGFWVYSRCLEEVG